MGVYCCIEMGLVWARLEDLDFLVGCVTLSRRGGLGVCVDGWEAFCTLDLEMDEEEDSGRAGIIDLV